MADKIDVKVRAGIFVLILLVACLLVYVSYGHKDQRFQAVDQGLFRLPISSVHNVLSGGNASITIRPHDYADNSSVAAWVKEKSQPSFIVGSFGGCVKLEISADSEAKILIYQDGELTKETDLKVGLTSISYGESDSAITVRAISLEPTRIVVRVEGSVLVMVQVGFWGVV